MATDLAKVAKEKKIKYFLISFVDLFGVLRAKLVPARAIGDMQKDGAGFAGFAAWLDMTPAHPDMFGVPDPESLIQLPWKPEVGWLAADLWMDGREVEASPRVMLKRQLQMVARREQIAHRERHHAEGTRTERQGSAVLLELPDLQQLGGDVARHQSTISATSLAHCANSGT